MEGLFQVPGTEPVYYISGNAKRHIPNPTALITEFGQDAWGMIKPITAAQLAAIGTVGQFGQAVNNFNVPGVSGGGTISFGNQQVKGSIWTWLALAAVAVLVLPRLLK